MVMDIRTFFERHRTVIVWIFRLIVGGTFIISGLAKMIDVWGSIYKIEQYLNVWGVPQPRSIVFFVALMLSGVEFILGCMLATGSYKRVSVWAMTALMAFMLPLTLYIAIDDPVPDCGCFGDFLVISNTATFLKNVLLVAMLVYLLFFTQKGRCYWLKVYDLPEGAKNAKGRAIQNLLNIEPDDAVNAVIRIKKLDDKEYVTSHNLVFATKRGIIKKTSLEAYSRPRANGVNAIIIREGDQLIGVELTNGNSEVLLANRNGRAIRFPENKVREMGRMSTGVRGMTLDGDEDEVVGMICMNADTTNNVMVISEKGYGKRSPLEDYRVTNRGGKGVKTINVTEKTGKLVAIDAVNDDNDLVIINKSGITLRIKVADIRVQGRATQGVRLINLEKRNDEIASVCCVDSDPEEEINENVLVDESEQTPLPIDIEEITEIDESVDDDELTEELPDE